MLKQKIKLCNVEWQNNENIKKINNKQWVIISKKTTSHVQLLFCMTTTWNFNSLATHFMEDLHVFLFTFFSLPLVFTLVATGISHFLTAILNILCFSSNENHLRFFKSLTLAHSSRHQNLVKKRLLFVVIFLLKSLGGHVVYRQNARVLEMQNFSPPYMTGWMYRCTILICHNQNFLDAKITKFCFFVLVFLFI